MRPRTASRNLECTANQHEKMNTTTVYTSADERRGKPSASGLERIALCPGSWNLERQIAPDSPGPEALVGTRLHENMHEGTMPEDPEEAEAVQWCREKRTSLVVELLGTEEAACEVITETRFEEKQGLYTGALDFAAISGDKAVLIDYKFGRDPVPAASQNIQLAAYAILLLDARPNLETVYALIMQPFHARPSQPKICAFDRSAAEQARSYITKILAATASEKAPLRPSLRGCKYCRALDTCPAMRLQVTQACTVADAKVWDQIPAENKVVLYKNALMAQKMVDKIMKHTRADLEAGIDLPGLILAPGRSSFTITDPQAAYCILAEDPEIMLSAEDFTACCKVSISSLDKAVLEKLKEINPKVRVKDAKDRVREILSSVGEMKTTAGTIKEVSSNA